MQSSCSPLTTEWNRCSLPPKHHSPTNAGNMATLSTDVPTCSRHALSPRSPRPKLSITVLNLPALRVAIANTYSVAANSRWRPVLSARRSTLLPAGIVPSAEKPLELDPRCRLGRPRTICTLQRTNEAR